MKILLTGANGFVGRRIYERYREEVIVSPSLRGLVEDEVYRIVAESGADVIINTAAISNMAECEADPGASYYANVCLPEFLARAAGKCGCKLICFSSDQVYNGSEKPGPYREEDAAPANVYGGHKLEMENRVLDICPDSVMLRAEWMYDCNAGKVTYFDLVNDAREHLYFSSQEYRGVTWVREVADEMEHVVLLPGGAYNFGSETDQSLYDITRDFAAYLGREISLEDVPPRRNLWMDCSKARRGGVSFSTVLDGLKKCAAAMRQQVRNA